MTITHIYYGYLEDEYLAGPYLTATAHGIMGMQVEMVPQSEVGMQSTMAVLNALDANGMQSNMTIVDILEPVGMQSTMTIVDALDEVGMQTTQVRVFEQGFQVVMSLYNDDNLRIMCEFPSRGTDGVGNNAWGNPKGEGENWVATSTEPGDFTPFNLNTDIVEQYWRSNDGDVTSLILRCDTETTQVFVDTLAILNHNLTTSAVATFEGSNDSAFGTVGVSIPLQVLDENIYWISPELPLTGFRYWRLVIDDPTNPDNFIRIGTIIFGASDIFQGECHTDVIQFGFKDFADRVETEGFTNVMNSRALKKRLHLEFQSLRNNLSNFRLLRRLGTVFRTTHKCLWIPTPSSDDQTITERFAVFGKLESIPSESHNYKGPSHEYVDLVVDVDESL